MLSSKSRASLAALLIAPLIASCGTFRPPPAEPIVTTQIIEKKINPPRRPGEINSADFAHWLPLAQNHFAEIEKKVQAGEMAPLNHMCLPYQDYLTMGQWMKDILRYIKQAEVYMDSVEEQAGEVK